MVKREIPKVGTHRLRAIIAVQHQCAMTFDHKIKLAICAAVAAAAIARLQSGLIAAKNGTTTVQHIDQANDSYFETLILYHWSDLCGGPLPDDQIQRLLASTHTLSRLCASRKGSTKRQSRPSNQHSGQV
ncbi:MAG: hypothetical protein FRX49_04588 [Trebouxia sp. A1-2]|nr:MAG: hypothetical protein FRX49_04588 [Trebouxia sp. A1-2]